VEAFGQIFLTKKLAVSQETLIKTLLRQKQPSFKQGLSVKKTLLTAVFVSALLFSAVAEALLIQNAPRSFVVQAETSEVTHESTNFANVTIQSPENKTYNENNVTLAFTIESDIPPVENFSRGTYALYYVRGCVLDNDTSQFVYDVTNKYYVIPNNVPVAFSGSGNRYVGNTTLTGLSQGHHTVTVWLRAQRFMISYAWIEGVVFATASFSIPPQITVLSPETKTYNVSDVPLDFTVNETFSKIEYSLDAQSNVTISGNVILTGLSNGYHNVTVYATDEFGSTGVSKITRFTVEVPEHFPTTLVIASVTILAVVGIGLFVYFKKRKH
jgi:hypothetical protein